MRGTGLTSYVGICKGHLTDQDISLEKSKALDSPPTLEHAKLVGLILIRNADDSHPLARHLAVHLNLLQAIYYMCGSTNLL